MGKVQSNLRRLQIVILFLSSACVIDKILPTLFWKRKDSASPIENGTEDEDSTEELKSVHRANIQKCWITARKVHDTNS